MKNIIIIGACLITFTLGISLGANLATPPSSTPSLKPIIATIKVTPKYIDSSISPAEIRTKWIKLLNLHNPELHDAVLASMLASKASGKEVFIWNESEDATTRLKYKLSYERGGAENLFSYSHKDKWFSFDHYSEKLGPTLQMAESMIAVDQRISKYYTELDIK
jgi:hypothetical protein